MHTVLKWIDYYRYTFTSLILVAVIVVGVVGCEPKVDSPLTGNRVTHDELVAEVEVDKANLETQWAAIAKKMELLAVRTGPAFKELERKQLALTQGLVLIDQLITQYAGPAGAPIAGALGLAGIFLGLGAKADSKRKDAVIAENKATKTK